MHVTPASLVLCHWTGEWSARGNDRAGSVSPERVPLDVILVSIVDQPLSWAETADRRVRPIVIVGVHPRVERSETFCIAREELSVGELLQQRSVEPLRLA